MSSVDVSHHFLLVPWPAWGHTRPICSLAARIILESNHTLLTILVAPNLHEKASSEISRHFGNGVPKQGQGRIRIVSMFASNELEFSKLLAPFSESYPVAYKTIYQGQPITCATTGKTFDAAPTPAAIILEYVGYPQWQATRAISGNSVPIIAWGTNSSAAVIRLLGPGSLGGYGTLVTQLAAEAARVGKSIDEMGDEVLLSKDGVEVNVPGLPTMYDYELFPQELLVGESLPRVIKAAYSVLMECDAAIILSNEAYEKTSLDALKSWFSELQKPVYPVAPLLPHGYGSVQAPIGAGGAQVAAFLDGVLARYGERSALFMSFGTVFWPKKQEFVEEVIEALLEKKVPFIFCHASPVAKIAETLVKKVSSTDLGLIIPWAPQEFILNHAATGWFLTHAGHGGVMESLSSGIPLICWPFTADQPIAAAHLSENLRVALELVEVRTGLGLKPLYRTGKAPKGTQEAVREEIRRVIDASRGQEGVVMRQKAEKLKAEFGRVWEEGGQSKRELQAFLQKYAS